MSTYLELTNAVLRRMNESLLNSTNFATSYGVHATAREAVNSAVRKINQKEFQWPFNHRTVEQTLTPLQQFYTVDATTKVIDWHSFRIKRDVGLDISASKLRNITYNKWLDSYFENDENSDEGAKPQYVFSTQELRVGVSPKPDKAYTLVYESWGYPDSLVNHADICTIPERFNHVIYDGAQYVMELFKRNYEVLGPLRETFRDGISDMRTQLINKDERVRV